MASENLIVLPICAICRDEASGDLYIVATTCGHVFHQTCFDEWNDARIDANENTKCPTCNAALSSRPPFHENNLITLHSLSKRSVVPQESFPIVISLKSSLKESQEALDALKTKYNELGERNTKDAEKLSTERKERAIECAAHVEANRLKDEEIRRKNEEIDRLKKRHQSSIDQLTQQSTKELSHLCRLFIDKDTQLRELQAKLSASSLNNDNDSSYQTALLDRA